MSFLLEESDLIPLDVYYVQKKNAQGVKVVRVLEPEKAKTLLSDPKTKDDVKVLKTRWRQMSWSIQQKLYSESAKYDPATGVNQTNWPIFSDLTMKYACIEWDEVDEKTGQKIPVLPEYIDRLPSAIGNELLSMYRRATLLDDSEGGF